MSTPEQAPQGPETNVEAPKAGEERSAELLEQFENGGELQVESGEKAAEKAKVEALENAVSVEKGGAEKDKAPKHTPAAPKRRGGVGKKESEASFKKTIKQVQAEMSPSERAFSKVIHNKAIEKTSDVVGATIARPNAILAGAVTAFVLVLAVYFIAKNLGYVLSGFETIGAFIIGWVIGILFDYFRIMVTGKK